MPTDKLETLRQFAWEGVLTPWTAGVLAAAAAALAAWMLWRERYALSLAWRVVFWALRMGAVGMVLWMLLGPTVLTIERRTSPQSIAIFVDESDSMGVVDATAPAEAARWRRAREGDRGHPVVLCDRAALALRAASDACVRGQRDHHAHAPLGLLRDRLAAVRDATTRASDGLRQAMSKLDAVDQSLADRADRVVRLIDDAAADTLQTTQDEAARGDSADVGALGRSIELLGEYVGGARRRAESLAADVADAYGRRESVATSAADTRLAKVLGVTEALDAGPLDELDETCVVHRLRFSSRVATLQGADDESADLRPASYDRDEPASPSATDLSAVLEAIDALRRERPLRVALVLTDGRHNAPESLLPLDAAAKLAGQPVHFVAVGESKRVRDIGVHRVEAPKVVALGDSASVEVLVTASDCAGEEVDVVLRRDGQDVERETIAVDVDRVDRRVTFRVEADALGWRQYDVEIEPVTDEASLANNLASVTVEVVRNKLRVLLADHAPRWEHRYLQQLFRRDAHVEFDEILQLPRARATGAREASGAFPQSADAWAEYEVVILGDVAPAQLTPPSQRALVEYVTERGGNLILIAGAEHMPAAYVGQPLMELVPVEPTPPVDPTLAFTAALDEEANLASCVMLRDSFAESRAVWRRVYTFAPLYGLSEYSIPKPSARTLVAALPVGGSPRVESAEGRSRAFFCWAPIGAGKSAYLSAPHTYQLRFRRGDRDHHRFWGQTLRWIMASQAASGSELVRISTDNTTYEYGQRVEVTVWLKDTQGRPVRDAQLAAEARSLDAVAATAQLTPDAVVAGRYSGSFDRLPVGGYEVAPVGEVIDKLPPPEGAEPYRTLVSVQATPGRELLDTQANRPLLEQIAEMTGGSVLPPTAAAELFELASLDPTVEEFTPERAPQWNRWSYLLIILGCLFTEWLVRKQKGLT